MPVFDYDLPPDRIAQRPAEPRDAAHLMVVDRSERGVAHRIVRDLPDLLEAGDLLVVNDTKVLPARLEAQRPSGGKVEVFLVRPRPDGTWQALIRSRGRVKAGDRLRVGKAGIVVASHEGADWAVRVDGGDPLNLMAEHGSAPLPPYIRREADDADRERYQTVFAMEPGAVAAPTAGLHFTPDLIARLKEKGVGWAALTLHVGPGTFRTEVEAKPDPESYVIPEGTRAAVKAARRVVAVGTTSARALETWAATGKASGWTDLVILPGFRFQAVGAILTNFHLPGTSLLALAAAFVGEVRLKAAYAEALREGYRFYSYGDAMLVL